MTRPVLPDQLDHARITLSDGVSLHVTLAGPPQGTPVLLLHGFPEFWYGWRHQIGPLADAGYRVIAPDLRGYNLSDKPGRLIEYHPARLVRDVVELIDEYGHGRERSGHGRVALVGHDWGGAIGWLVAAQHPERVSRFVALNIPHPLAFRRGLRTWRQLRRSWYMFFFLLPRVPEWWLGRDGSSWPLQWILRGSKRDSFSIEDQARYREAHANPGAWRAMINWYRAFLRLRPRFSGASRVQVPTLLLWGRRDPALGEELAPPSMDYCDHGRLVLIDDAGHFVTHDAWQQVNAELLEFLADTQSASRDPDRDPPWRPSPSAPHETAHMKPRT